VKQQAPEKAGRKPIPEGLEIASSKFGAAILPRLRHAAARYATVKIGRARILMPPGSHCICSGGRPAADDCVFCGERRCAGHSAYLQRAGSGNVTPLQAESVRTRVLQTAARTSKRLCFRLLAAPSRCHGTRHYSTEANHLPRGRLATNDDFPGGHSIGSAIFTWSSSGRVSEAWQLAAPNLLEQFSSHSGSVSGSTVFRVPCSSRGFCCWRSGLAAGAGVRGARVQRFRQLLRPFRSAPKFSSFSRFLDRRSL